MCPPREAIAPSTITVERTLVVTSPRRTGTRDQLADVADDEIARRHGHRSIS
jgi:hypothetical protein